MKEVIYTIIAMLVMFFVISWLAAVKFIHENKVISQELKECQTKVESYEKERRLYERGLLGWDK